VGVHVWYSSPGGYTSCTPAHALVTPMLPTAKSREWTGKEFHTVYVYHANTNSTQHYCTEQYLSLTWCNSYVLGCYSKVCLHRVAWLKAPTRWLLFLCCRRPQPATKALCFWSSVRLTVRPFTPSLRDATAVYLVDGFQ